MHLLARRGKSVALLIAAALLGACGLFGDTPTPTPPKPAPTQAVVIVLPTPTISPTPSVTPRPTLPPPKDPMLPSFGPFPPIPIPVRPANLNPLTGQVANPVSLERRPIVVRIGNDEKVRTNLWQAGFNSADVVFEELIDEIGTQYVNTRYSAVFLSHDPPLIGPIRSGRIVNLQIVPMLDGALAHAGASNGTRWLFSQTPITNLDEYFNMPAYCYMKTHGYQGRLYTTGPRLREWLEKKGWEQPVPLYGFLFSDTAPAGQPVQSISLLKAPWPKWDQVEWRYDAATGKYTRWVTGMKQIDNSFPVTAKWANGADCVVTGKANPTPVESTNVVVLYADHQKTNIVEDTNHAVSVRIYLTGQGDAAFFRDGVMVKGKWLRAYEQDFFQFLDATGQPIALRPGTTWFEIVPTGYTLDLK